MRKAGGVVWSSAHAGAKEAAATWVEGEKDSPCPLHAVHAGLAPSAQGPWVSGGEKQVHREQKSEKLWA